MSTQRDTRTTILPELLLASVVIVGGIAGVKALVGGKSHSEDINAKTYLDVLCNTAAVKRDIAEMSLDLRYGSLIKLPEGIKITTQPEGKLQVGTKVEDGDGKTKPLKIAGNFSLEAEGQNYNFSTRDIPQQGMENVTISRSCERG